MRDVYPMTRHGSNRHFVTPRRGPDWVLVLAITFVPAVAFGQAAVTPLPPVPAQVFNTGQLPVPREPATGPGLINPPVAGPTLILPPPSIDAVNQPPLTENALPIAPGQGIEKPKFINTRKTLKKPGAT